MAKQTPEQLIGIVEHQFKLQYPMNQLYQTLSEHFYPERADFTVTRNVGTEFGDMLVDSYPILARRDLGNSFAAMLRDGKWFEVGVNGEIGHEGKKWLEWASARLMSKIKERGAGFKRATKEGDHDYATFGQCCISIELNKQANGLLYRCWHLRDLAWWEDETGEISGVARKWKPTYRDLVSQFGDKCHDTVKRNSAKQPFKQAEVRHLVMPSDMYGDPELEKYPYVSLYLDVEHKHIMEAVGLNHKFYVIPRFHTIQGSAYAYSPATIIALPNARTLQAMTFTLLEAAERYARPPMIAQENVIRGDVDLSANGITYIDEEYDERVGEALRPISFDRGGFPAGLEMRQNTVGVLSSAFYLDKLSLPETSREMTAYEVQERMKQYRREVLPLFAPIESEYNGQICEMSWDLSMQAGFLGSPYDIPEELQDREVEFQFRSPLSQSEEELKANQFAQMSQRLAEAAQFDEQAIDHVNFDVAIRDAILGMDTPAKWLYSVEEVLNNRNLESAAMMAQQQALAEQEPVE